MKNILKSRYYVSDIVTGVLFFFLPFWSIPLIIFQLIKTRRVFYTMLISTFFGLTASLLAPTGDLYRLYITYFDFQEYDFDAFSTFLSVKPDFLFYALLYVFAKLGLSIRIIIFFMTFSFFQLSFDLLLKHRHKINVLILLLFVMQFDFLLQGLFLRFPLAMLCVIYAFIRKLEQKKYSFLILLLAASIHFAALIAIPLYFLSKVSNKKLSIILVISLFIMPFGSAAFIFLTTHFIEYFPDIPLKLKIESYFLGYWALEYFDDRTWKALLQFYTERALYITILLYFIVTKCKNIYRPYVISFLILINILFSFPNLFSRYAVLATFFGLFTIIMEQKKGSVSQLIKMSLIILIPVIFSIRIVAQQKNIRAGYIPQILYSNAGTLSLKTYDMKWIDKHIDKDTARPKNIDSL